MIAYRQYAIAPAGSSLAVRDFSRLDQQQFQRIFSAMESGSVTA